MALGLLLAMKEWAAGEGQTLKRRVILSTFKEITPLQYYGLGVYEDANGRGRHGHSWSPCILSEVLV